MTRKNTAIRLLGAAGMGALGAASGYAIGGDQAAIALGLCSAVVALPFRWTHPHRWKQTNEQINAEKPVASMFYPGETFDTPFGRVTANQRILVRDKIAKEGYDKLVAMGAVTPEATSADIVRSLFLGICPDEQTRTIWWFDDAERPHERHFRCKSCDGNWIVRLAKGRRRRDYGGFDVEKVQP